MNLLLVAKHRHGAAHLRWALPLALIAIGVIGFACGNPGGPPGAVHILGAQGTVGPVMSSYIDRGIDNAEDNQANAVLIRLDTPGGLAISMNNIVERILNANVPVIVYVWPQGAQAASAGTFITMAGHVAAMAPGTRIGAATPVGAGGEDIEGALGNKVINDAVAQLRGIAELRGRNADWAEEAVREGASLPESDALEMNVVDLVARNLDELLAAVDGRQVTLHDGRSIGLETAAAARVFNNRTVLEEFLDIISNPNIAFLLLSLGTLALFFELANPGAIFPGVFGVIALIVGFFALSVIPFNWAGIALLVTAFILFGLEIFITSHGLLGLGGVISLVLGGMLLTSGNPPEFQVNRWLIYGVGIAMGLFMSFIVLNILRIRRLPVQVGVETMVGRQAVARSELNPSGFVFLDGEYWRAEALDGHIEAGQPVIITEVEGMKLKVKKQQSEGG